MQIGNIEVVHPSEAILFFTVQHHVHRGALYGYYRGTYTDVGG